MSSTIFILGSLVILFIVGIFAVIRVIFVPANDDRLSILSGSASAKVLDEGAMGGQNRKSAIQKNLAAKPLVTKQVKTKVDDSVLLFQAGIFSDEDRAELKKKCLVFTLCALPVFVFIGFFVMGMKGLFLGGAIGVLAGRIFPDKIKNSRIESRREEASYYLPLAIEQLSMGVSSGLDIGPCIAYVVEMADQRGANNVIIELFAHALKLSRAGMSLEEGLLEVGGICGVQPVQNTFMFLAQCSKHGGEISKQLLDLSESVTNDRQSAIETKINALPNKATVALVLVFGGFFLMLLTGIMLKVATAFD